MGHHRLFTMLQEQPNANEPSGTHLDPCSFNYCHTSGADHNRGKEEIVQEESQSHRRLADDFCSPQYICHVF